MRTTPLLGNDLLWQWGEGIRKGPCSHITYLHILDIRRYSSHLPVLLLHYHSCRHRVSDSTQITQLYSVAVFLPWYLLSHAISILSRVTLRDLILVPRQATARHRWLRKRLCPAAGPKCWRANQEVWRLAARPPQM